jgi:uncharacterized repeat protein (TIGR01451 family)
MIVGGLSLPANADDSGTPPTSTNSSDSTPSTGDQGTPTEATPVATDPATPSPSPSASPSDSSSPAASPSPTATPSPTSTPTPQALSSQTIKPLVAAAAVPGRANITVHAGGVRTGATAVGPLPDGAVFTATAVSGSPAGGPFTCTTSGGNATCVISVPKGFTWNVQETVAPSGYYLNPSLDFGKSDNLTTAAYKFNTGLVNADIDVPGPVANGGYPDLNNKGNNFSGLLATSVDNPQVAPQCGLKIALVLDQSHSMSHNGKQALLKSSANNAITALTGTPSNVAIYTFGADVGPNAPSASTLTAGSAQSLHNFVNALPASPPGLKTNWDAGLHQVPAGYNMVIFLTDGAPSAYANGLGNGGLTFFQYVEQGIYSANALKAEGTTVISVGVGVSGAAQNLRAVSGPTLNSDYYLESNSSFGQRLTTLATGNCDNTLSISKNMQDANGNLITPAPADTNGWDFTTTVDGAALPVVTTAPAAGLNGLASVTLPPVQAGASRTVKVAETLKDGFTFQGAACTLNGTAVQNPTVDQANASISFTFTAPAGPVVLACSFTNREPAGVVNLGIVKTHAPLVGNAVDSGKNDPIDYSLVVTNNGTEPATNVVVSDPLPQGLTGQAGSISAPAGWTVSFDAANTTLTGTFAGPFNPGDSATITFTAIVGALQRSGVDVPYPDIVNTACVTEAEPDTNSADNCSSDTVKVKSIALDADAICSLDAPYVQYTLTPYNVVDQPTIALIWWTADGYANRNPNIPADDEAAILADGAQQVNYITLPPGWQNGQPITGQQLWPGAAVGPDGHGTAWPGWRQLANGDWVKDPSAPFYNLSEKATIEIRINPSSGSTEVYPPATPNCNAAPPANKQHPSAGGSGLADTGTNIGPIFDIGAVLLALGAILLIGVRRRRRLG